MTERKSKPRRISHGLTAVVRAKCKPELAERVEALAEHLGVERSEAIRQALYAGLGRLERLEHHKRRAHDGRTGPQSRP